MMRGDVASVEITASPVSAISPESIVNGTKACFAIDLAGDLPHEKASIGYRIFGRNQVVKRGVLNGSSLSWSKNGEIQRGIGEIEVPAGAIIDCIASYAGVAQQHLWITDPKTAQNPLRSVHDAFDTNLSVLRELIEKSQRKGVDARELELAVSWLLWLLGFSAAHIGGAGKTSDAPDLIAATPLRNLVVIECTTGILREDSKLPHLVQRAEKVRQCLTASGNQHVKVLPIIVTTKTHDEVKAELEQAYKLGVLVATREDFERIIGRTVFLPDPNHLFAEGEAALQRLQNPPQFSLPM
jgi:Holliday junction resolvase